MVVFVKIIVKRYQKSEFRKERGLLYSRKFSRTLMSFRNYQFNLFRGGAKNELGGFNLWLGQAGGLNNGAATNNPAVCTCIYASYMRQAQTAIVKLQNILSGTRPKYNNVKWIYRSHGRICPDAFGCDNKILSFATAIKLKPGQTCGLMVADRLLIWSLWASKINAASGTSKIFCMRLC